MTTIKIGTIYQHYSGKQYKVIAVGYHSESLEQCVVYQALYDDPKFGPQAIWIRPLHMFAEDVIINGKQQPRFKELSS